MRSLNLVWIAAVLDTHVHPLAAQPCGTALDALRRPDGACRDTHPRDRAPAFNLLARGAACPRRADRCQPGAQPAQLAAAHRGGQRAQRALAVVRARGLRQAKEERLGCGRRRVRGQVDQIEARKLEKGVPKYLGRPASSAGVERMFSKAGTLYDDARKGQNDETIEAALFASANTE